MGVQAATLQAGLVAASASTDTAAPTSTITSPAAGATITPGSTVTVTGTATDTGGRVGGVEVSVDGGTTWHPAAGRESWTYTWTAASSGSVTIQTRAADDSGNIEVPGPGVTVGIGSPPPPPPSDDGAGGPILVVRGTSNLYGRYYNEVLRAEGLVGFSSMTVSSLMAQPDPLAALAPFKVVLLAESNLTASQEQVFRSYAQGGGSLIAMRPDRDLADLFGLTFVGPRSEQSLQYFAVDTTRQPGTGIAGASLQYHGQADNYSLNGATALGYLWNSLTTPSTNPAATLRTVGSGRAAAFTFDLATSIVLMRQGNPAWKDTEGCDGLDGYRPMDMFVRCNGDKWLAPERTTIPQADEQQRFLANLILMLSTQPLPRMWYLPGLNKTLMVNTGDSEDLAGPAIDRPIRDANGYGGAFTTYMTTYAVNNTTAALEASWRSAGNETGAHVWGGGPQDYATLRTAYSTLVNSIQTKYGHGSRTARSHTIDWTGWSEMAEIEAEFATRLDTNYYHYAKWLLPFGRDKANGYFAGSGLPQRFSDETGAVLPVHLAPTQWSDEWFSDNGWTADQTAQVIKDMLTAARNGYYSAFVNNIHHVRYNGGDSITRNWANQIWAYCRDNGIPMWSAEKLLDFLDARNGARFDNLAWNGSTLSFDFKAPSAGQSLTIMLPMQGGTGQLTSVTLGGSPATYTTQTIKGRGYGMVTTTSGSTRVVASYGTDTTPPVISGVQTQSVTSSTATITWSTNEPANSRVDYGLAPTSLNLSKADPTLVTSHSVQLTGLTANTTYYYRVSSADAAGNAASSTVQSFTTGASGSATWSETTVNDFSDGTLASTQVTSDGNGAVRLASTTSGGTFTDDFTQADGPAANWDVWPSSTLTPSWRVSGNVYVHDLNETVPSYHPSVLKSTFTPSGDFTLTARQRIAQRGTTGGDLGVLGFVVGGQDTQNYYVIQYAQGLGLKIYRRATGAVFTKIGEASAASPIVGQWYTLKVELTGTTFKVSIDGTLVLTASDAAYRVGRIGLLGYEGSRNEYDDVVLVR